VKRIWLVVDARDAEKTGTNQVPLPEVIANSSEQLWLERLVDHPPTRRNLLLREADVLIDRVGGDTLALFPKLPAWVESVVSDTEDQEKTANDTGPSATTFSPRHFDGNPSSLNDPDFERINRLLGEPAMDFASIGTAAQIKAKVKKHYEYLKEIVLICSLLPVALVAFSKLFANESDGIAVAQQILILTGFILTLTLWQTSLKNRWYEARAAREIWRSLHHSVFAIDAVAPVQARFFPQHRGLTRTLVQLAQRQSDPPPALDAKRYLDKRIGGQFEFFEKNIREATRLHRLLRAVFLTTATISAICAVVMLLAHLGVFPDAHLPWIERSFKKFGAALFPSISGASLGLIGLMGTARRSGFYAIMIEHLKALTIRFERLIDGPGSAPLEAGDNECRQSLNDLIIETESVLLEEVAGWVRRNQF